MATLNQKKKIQRQKQEIRGSLWPTLNERDLWLRKTSDGWLSIPRPMPLILRIMDMLAPKGKPISQTYTDLWCRTFDDSFVIAAKPREMAYYSGFSGERAVRTWMSRMQILKELRFIDYKQGTSGPIHYILIFNPYHVIKKHRESGDLQEGPYNALRERMIEIRASDLDEEKKPQGARRGGLPKSRAEK